MCPDHERAAEPTPTPDDEAAGRAVCDCTACRIHPKLTPYGADPEPCNAEDVAFARATARAEGVQQGRDEEREKRSKSVRARMDAAADRSLELPEGAEASELVAVACALRDLLAELEEDGG